MEARRRSHRFLPEKDVAALANEISWGNGEAESGGIARFTGSGVEGIFMKRGAGGGAFAGVWLSDVAICSFRRMKDFYGTQRSLPVGMRRKEL